MIQKAIVVGVSNDAPYKYKVRVPVIHGLSSTPGCTTDEELPFAPVCNVGGFYGVINVGDVVYVAFENGEFDTPVIIGQLITGSGASNLKGNNSFNRPVQTGAKLKSLEFEDDENTGESSARLPENTTIGSVSPFEISTLYGIKQNIQVQLNSLLDVAYSVIDIFASQGLALTSNSDGTCYISGIGTCTDTTLCVPTTSPSGELITAISKGDSWTTGAFRSNTDIVSVRIPPTTTSINAGSFDGCSNLSSVVFSEGLTIIGNRAFYNCIGLTNVVLPNSLSTLGDASFYGCSGLSFVRVGDIVSSIGNSAFRECSNLTDLTIGKSVLVIGNYACDSCTRLTNINYQGTKAQWGAISKGNHWNSRRDS